LPNGAIAKSRNAIDDMQALDQLDLFTPKTVETSWTPGERRQLRGNVGMATLEIEIYYSGQSFHWAGHFHAPTFGTGTPLSGQQFSSAGSAFGAAKSFLRDWLTRNGETNWQCETNWQSRLERWLECKTLADFQPLTKSG
jgi:hypothetical protein